MRLLIIGTGDSQIGLAGKIARERGATVSTSPNIESALSLLRSGKGADLLMADVALDIKSLVQALDQERIHVPVVCYGLNADSNAAVTAIKAGAKEYIPLPPDEEMIAAILEAVTQDSSTLIFKSAAIKKIVDMADRVAFSDASVLITGESGTGKEVIARYIHNKSKRAKENFISINCAAIPDNLLESELFGHEKGAFTGAVARRIGKFEESNNGTLLLDEISEMDLRLQAKLLRALQEKEIDRVGGSKPVQLNLRILATSNRDLRKEVEKGNFREDLLFRLNVIELNLPPLSERKEDIKPLAENFVAKYSAANGLKPLNISESAIVMMMDYDWPGNVRELENAMHRAVLLAGNEEIGEDVIILGEALSSRNKIMAAGAGGAGVSGDSSFVGRTVESVERDLIIGTLEHCLGNRTHAANILGISIRTLRNKLKQYGKDE